MIEVGVFFFVIRTIAELQGTIRIADRRITPKSTPFDALLALKSTAVFSVASFAPTEMTPQR